MYVFLLCLVIAASVQTFEIHKLCKILLEEEGSKIEKTPPKGRGSFIVKRFEERIKEALYE